MSSDGSGLSPEQKRARLKTLLSSRAEPVRSAPLSFGQERIWFLEQLAPDSASYCETMAFRVEASEHASARILRRVLNEIVRRHDSLRTTFVIEEGQARQKIAPFLSLSVPMVDLSQLDPREREREVQSAAQQQSRRPFRLDRGPLLRMTGLRLSSSEGIMVLTIHHIVTDGWSMGVLLGEMLVLYSAFSRGLPSPLPALSLQYADYVHWQRERLQGERLEALLDHWREKLRDLPTLDLPTDRPRPRGRTEQGASLPLALGPGVTSSLKRFSRDHGVTPFMVMLAAFEVLLSRYSEQTDFAVGSPVSGRDRKELQDLSRCPA
jgi:hypothetical protein